MMILPRISRHTLALLLSCCILGWLFNHAAAASTPLRAVILFDVSGSMNQHDPHRLSRVAAELFLELARPHDQMALVTFSETGEVQIPLMSLASPAAKVPFLARLRDVAFTGQTTNLVAALETALQSLPAQPAQSSRDVVLLLTDGKLDLGKRRRHEEPVAMAYIQNALLPAYQKRGVALYTIAFTEHADQDLLRHMAAVTQGEFRFTSTATALHTAFSQLFVVASEAEATPLRDGEFVVDPSIRQASVVVSKAEADEPISLTTPKAQRLNAQTPHPGVQWNATRSFDLVQLSDPEPGPWQVEKPSGVAEGMVVVGDSTLRLEVELSPGYHEAGAPLQIEAVLRETDPPAQASQPGETLSVHANLSGEESAGPVQLARDATGRFRATLLAPSLPGRYTIQVVAQDPSFSRQRELTMQVHPRCFIASTRAGAPATVRVRLSEDCPIFYDLQLDMAMSSDGTPPVWARLKSPKPRLFEAALRPTTEVPSGDVTIRIRGRLEGEEPFTLLKGPLPLPSPFVSSTVNWPAIAQTVTRQLLLLNVILGILGGGGYTCYRSLRRRRRA